MNERATAHRAWEAIWSTSSGRAAWSEPEAEVLAACEELREFGVPRALDLGCGVGRHALQLARCGFDVCALDASRAGIARARGEAARRALRIGFAVGGMLALPYRADRFDYVLAWNVIYHGDEGVVRGALAEIRRVLCEGGIFQGTLLSRRNARFGRGREVAPHTFADAGGGEKAHPHFYCDAAQLRALLCGFELLSLAEREHAEPGSHHWHLLARLRCAESG